MTFPGESGDSGKYTLKGWCASKLFLNCKFVKLYFIGNTWKKQAKVYVQFLTDSVS